MKKSVVIRANKLKRIKRVNLDIKVLFLLTLIICGTIIGITVSKSFIDNKNTFISDLIISFFSACRKLTFFPLATIFVISLSMPVILSFLLGFSALGSPVLAFLCFINGWASGAVIGTLFIKEGVSGFMFSLLLLIPFYAIAAALLIKCCCEGIKTSVNLFSCFSKKQFLKGESSLREYCIFHLIILGILLFISLIRAIFFTLFSGFFGIF